MGPSDPPSREVGIQTDFWISSIICGEAAKAKVWRREKKHLHKEADLPRESEGEGRWFLMAFQFLFLLFPEARLCFLCLDSSLFFFFFASLREFLLPATKQFLAQTGSQTPRGVSYYPHFTGH